MLNVIIKGATRIALTLAVAAGMSYPATAQTQPTITLYAQNSYRGPSLRLILPANDLHTLGWANRTVSFLVTTGTWQLCSKANFAGHCFVAGPGKYPMTYQNGISRTVVSLQPVTKPAP